MRFSRGNHSPLAGLLWVSSIQYFIVQVIVIAAWPVPHSLANNFISDLGNTECGTYADVAVCSPLWPLMNLSFIVFGLTMATGAWLLLRSVTSTKLARVALGFMILAGIGTILVGLFPENTIGMVHTSGAFLSLAVGNISVVLIGLSLADLSRVMRTYTVASGLFSLLMFALFILEIHGPVGRGGVERLISYPFSVWMILFGMYVVLSLNSRRRRSI